LENANPIPRVMKAIPHPMISLEKGDGEEEEESRGGRAEIDSEAEVADWEGIAKSFM
jgi:hypothetical protein